MIKAQSNIARKCSWSVREISQIGFLSLSLCVFYSPETERSVVTVNRNSHREGEGVTGTVASRA